MIANDVNLITKGATEFKSYPSLIKCESAKTRVGLTQTKKNNDFSIKNGKIF